MGFVLISVALIGIAVMLFCIADELHGIRKILEREDKRSSPVSRLGGTPESSGRCETTPMPPLPPIRPQGRAMRAR